MRWKFNQKKQFKGSSGFTLTELLISSMLALLIISFVMTTLFEFFATEKMVTAQKNSYHNAQQALNNIKKSVELSGYIKTDSLSLVSSWNYLPAPGEEYKEGEIVKIGNIDSDLLRMRIIGDDYAPFNDCLGDEFSFPDTVYLRYSLENETLICEALHVTAADSQRKSLPVARHILMVNMNTVVFNKLSETWQLLENTKDLIDKKAVKAILVEILASSQIPIYDTEKSQIFRLFAGDVEINSTRKVVYLNELIPVANQERSDDF